MVNLLLATCLMAAATSMPLDPMVPVNPDVADVKTLASDLRTARERWGLRRFILVGPHAVNTQFNRMNEEAYRRLGERIAEVRGNLAGTDIELGWWLAPTLRQGFGVSGQHIVDCEGHVSDAVCPLDPGFTARMTAGIAATCRAGKPFIVFFEDDYELAWHRGMNGLGGCFCDLHLAAFAERYGKRLSSAEIAGAFRNRTAANEPIRRAFAETQKASLVAFASAIRRAIDGVDPKIRTCLCQSYRVDFDGDTTEAIARALAGGTRPAVRIYGARYNNENDAVKLPQTLAHTAWSAATLPTDIELIHESDPYPHNRFFSAASFLGSEIACAFMCGASDSYLYCSQYLDDPFEDGGYADWFASNRQRLAAVRDFRAKSYSVGVRVSFDPKEHYLVRESVPRRKIDFLSDGTYFLGKLGFPYAPVGGDAAILSEQSVAQMSDDEVRHELSGGVLLDGAAALALSARGFNELIGVAPERVDRLPVTSERILPASGCRKRGKKVNCWLLDPVGGVEANVLLRLKPLPGAEAWAEYVGPDDEIVAPSITVFKNALGGRVAVLSQGLSGNRSSSIYSPRKQELFANLFDWLSQGRLDVCAPETPCTWVLACISEKGDEMLVMVNNLAGETRDDVVLRLSEKWRGASVARLGMDGVWQPVGNVEGRIWRPSFALRHMMPEFFRLTRCGVAGGARYTPDVAARKQVRGVMLSQFTVGEDDFRTLKEWGATVARYQMYPVGERWKGKTSDTEGFASWLDWKLGVLKSEALPLARKYGIPLVVDLHVPPGGRGGSGMKMLDDPVWADFFVACWRKIAARLKGERGIYAFDLINEPTQFGKPKVCDYLEIQRRAAVAVREIDGTTPVVVSCRNDVAWCAPSAFKWMKPINLPNIFYQFHMYEPFEYTHQKVLPQFKETVVSYPDAAKSWDANGLRKMLAPVRDFEKKHGARIFVGEFSTVAYAKGGDKWISDTTSILNEYGWDWCYHAFREWPGWSVEHEVTDGDSAATAKFSPSADNPRRRALLAALSY